MPLIDLKTEITALTEELFSTEYNVRTTLVEVDEYHVIPLVSPYVVRLTEVPDDVKRVQVVGYTESSSMPVVGTEFMVDYSRGYVYFYSSVAGKVVRTVYFGKGSLVDATDINLITQYLKRAVDVTDRLKALPQITPDRSIRIKKGEVLVSGHVLVVYYGNSRVDMGPGKAYQLDAMNTDYYNKVAFSLSFPEVGVPPIVVELKKHEGTAAVTLDEVELPSIPVGNIPICLIAVQDDGSGGAGTIREIKDADIRDIRPFLTTALTDHGSLIGLNLDHHPHYLKKAGDTISGDILVVDGKKIDGRDISADGEALDGIDTPAKLLSKIKQVDGSGSGLDADLLDNRDGAYYEKLAGGRRLLSIYMEGEAFDEETFFYGLKFDEDTVIDRISLWARVQPTGADMNIDVLKDGAEQNRIAVLKAGTSYETTKITPIMFLTDELLGLKTKSVGSIEKGGKVTVILHYTAMKTDFLILKSDIRAKA